MTLSDQINNYLGKTFHSKEAKDLRPELSRHGATIVFPLLQMVEPKIKQRADLAHFPTGKLDPSTESAVETASRQSVLDVLDNAMKLVREIGPQAEAPLIVALGGTSLCIRSQAALFLGMAAVRSNASVPYLKKLASNNREHIAVRLAAAASLMNNENTDQETWNEMASFLKSWADKTFPNWEANAKKQGKHAQEAISTMVQAMIPHLLVAELTLKDDGNMFCANCGAKLPEEAKFCTKCGKLQKDTNKTEANEDNILVAMPESGQISQEWAQALARYVVKLRAEAYPDALIFTATTPLALALAAIKGVGKVDFTPAFLVSDFILCKDSYTDFRAAFTVRSIVENNSFSSDVNKDEITGYINSLIFFVAESSSAFAFNDVNPLLLGDVIEMCPSFKDLSLDEQMKAEKFVLEHALWGVKNLKRQDIQDGKNFMNEVVTLATQEECSAPYCRGARTARDTLLLYVDLVQAVLAKRI